MREQTLYPTQGGRELIQNKVLLGNSIGFRPQYMAYASKYRNDLQRRKEIEGRTVYAPRAPLSYIQQRVGDMLSYAFDEAQGNESAIAYRRGLDVRRKLRELCKDCVVLVKTDIRKYYDHVTRGKINKALESVGFVEDGPKTVARYLVVRREVPNRRDGDEGTHVIETLQQGSSASPAMANIAGREFFDKAIEDWLKINCKVKWRYYRYSDNIALFLAEDPGQEWIETYKEFVKDVARGRKFGTHAWATLRKTNVARSQEFLGVVLNMTANVERRKRDWMRAVMFSALLKDFDGTAGWWCEMRGLSQPPDELWGTHPNALLRFAASMVGYAAYVVNVNPRAGKRLMKMAKLIEKCVNTNTRVDKGKLGLVKRYKIDTESVDEYVKKASVALTLRR